MSPLMRNVVVLPAVALLALLAVASQAQPLGPWQSGRSTFYQGIDNGACGFGSMSSGAFPFRRIAAPNTAFYADAKACGKCFEVKCVSSDYMQNACYSSSVVIQVTDLCPCEHNQRWCCGDRTHFDLSPEAFSKIANTVAGVINMQFRPVECPGPVKMKVHKDANPWWFAVLPTNVGGSGAVTRVEIKNGNSGTWRSMDRQPYGFFISEMGGNGFSFPVGIRVWQGSKVVSGTLPRPGAGASYPLSGNF